MTYDSYEAAKIANPESEIFMYGNMYQSGDSPCKPTEWWKKCNPADHCMTVEKFLADGHKFVEGDVYLDNDGLVVAIEVCSISYDSSPAPDDDKRFILRAAALETKDAKPFLQTGEEFEHTKTLNFIYERLIEVHGENPSYDYMHKLKNAIMMVEDRESPCNKAALKPRDNGYAMSVMEKKVKVEYFKEDSFKSVLKSAIDGEVFYNNSGNGQFKFDQDLMQFVNHNGDTLDVSHLTEHCFYRKVETEMTPHMGVNQVFESNGAHPADIPYFEIEGGAMTIGGTITIKDMRDIANMFDDSGKFKLVEGE